MCALIITSNNFNEQKLSSGDLCFFLPMLLLMLCTVRWAAKVSYQENKQKQRQHNRQQEKKEEKCLYLLYKAQHGWWSRFLFV